MGVLVIKKMLRKILLTILLTSVFTIGAIFLYNKFKSIPEKIHYHAGFQVYKDDLLQDFSGVKYITVLPCTEEEAHSEKNEQINKGHLHNQIGDVVHVHASGATWGDLFKNLKFSTQDGVVAFVDGKQLSNPLTSQIKSYQSIVFHFGKHDSNFKPEKKPVTVEYIKETEKKSVECGSN